MLRKSFILLSAILSLGVSGLVQAAPLVNCQVELDRGVLLAGPAQKTVIKIALDAPRAPRTAQRPPVNLALVLDRSGSMSGNKIAKAREAAIEAVRRLSDGDLFSLVVYDDSVETLVPAQPVSDIGDIEARIRRIRPGGSTALFGAVSQGAAEVRKHSDAPYVNRVVLLSDGLANVGPSRPADLARLGAALLKEGISVTTVGVGTDFNEDLMTQLAERSDGNHYFVESSRDLPRIFAAELGDVLSVVARKVVISIECPQGVKPLRVIGREGSIKGQRVEVRMNQLYGGQEKYALVEVEVPASRANQKLDLARVDCRYRNALTDTGESSTAMVQTRFSKRSEEVRKAASKDVQKAVVENEMAVARDRALNLYNAGRKPEAARVLRQKSQSLQEQNAILGFDDLAQEAGQLQDEAVEFESEQLDKTRKKELRSESFKVRKQQKAY
ncbi:VWFA superfamily protein [Syntrophotalea carbinolica DSM 2380]|uniref:VWFA superfamily protein n=1 Tax=Syntrophotalea carbinolica (strain DSM 2380 / NBRC 103641 / GraBd1) TaxID=338963 RepID=Q3A188_SYNC1|nr:VWA domain-containing protein [Syntrophotalea carbinolica]ABA89869.1 VWFA superfamily protein [Syntrophotalea carbinolica DSM 2380]